LESILVEEEKITLSIPEGSAAYGFVGNNARFYGVNLLSELDAINEYHIDLAAGKLTFYPPAPYDTWKDSDVDAVSLTNDKIALDATNAKNVVFKDLSITGAREVRLSGEERSVERSDAARCATFYK